MDLQINRGFMHKKEKDNLNIDKILLACGASKDDFYIALNVDNNLQYNKQYIVISNQILYLVDKDANIIKKYNNDDIVSLSNDSLIDFGKITINLKDKNELFCYFDKSQNNKLDFFINKAKDILNGNIKEDDKRKYRRTCPKCKKEIEDGKDYCTNCYSKKGTFIRLLSYIKNYKAPFILIIIFLILSSIIGVIIPIYTRKFFYNEVLDTNGVWYGKILLFVSFYLLLDIVSIILKIIYGRTLAKTSAKLCYDLKNEVFSSMQRLSYKFYTDKETGTLMNRVIWDTNMVFYFIIDDIPFLAVNFLKIIGITTYLLIANYRLAIFSFLFVPIAAFVFIKITPKLRNAWHQNYVRDSALSSMVSDTLEGFRVVKVFSGQEKEINKFSHLATRNMKATIRQRKIGAIVYPCVRLIIAAASLVIWGYGGYIVMQGNLDFGDFSTFVAGVEMLFGPLEWMCQILFGRSVRTLASARRMFEIIDGIPDVTEKENPVIINDLKGKINFNNVSFSYEPINPILENVSFEIKEGTKFGIVGETGSGKTTLMNLLSRLYDVNDGNITIDGIDIRDLSLDFLHKNVVMISQDTYLFKGSVYDNVKYGKDDATYEEIIEACRLANAHDFIINLKDGYDTLIGEGGVALSGGERQRISIARAILLKSKIIVFDEATSAMDTITERKIQESINAISDNRTIIMIAHRLSTLKDVDKLIVIDKHKVVESGTMEELVNLENGIFAKLYKIQQDGLKHIRIGE